MKEIKLYQCEYCHTQYSDKDNCRKCEESHRARAEIKKMKFVAKQEFPVTVDIEFPNGAIITYKR